MNKKSLLGLILFSCLIITGLFAGATFLISQGSSLDGNQTDDTKDDNSEKGLGEAPESASKEEVTQADAGETTKDSSATTDTAGTDTASSGDAANTTLDASIMAEEPWLSNNPTDIGLNNSDAAGSMTTDKNSDTSVTASDTAYTFSTALSNSGAPQLIYDCEEVDYMAYIPEMVLDGGLEVALDIENPGISVEAEAAILFDAETKEVLYYKNAVQAMFPASTAKLLTSIVALKWCSETEEVTIGDEITMIASDSTRAYLSEGQVLTIRNLLEGMLLPSGNDAAYAVATYVGRKSLSDPEATKEEAVAEFIRLMNKEAITLGVKNSCFMTPDGYDAIGQYTTAYDMGLIGIAAAANETITAVTQESCSRNIFVSGEDVTWYSTNKLVTKYSGQYYSCAIGLKTGTSSMAGRCIVAAAQEEGKRVVCVIMDSSSAGRWEDAIALLKYGLNRE